MNNAYTPIFDGHNDTLLRVMRASPEKPYDFSIENPTGHLDLPRARKGGLAGGLFAVFTPAPPASPERAEHWETTFSEAGYVQKLHSAIDPTYAREFTDAVLDRLPALQAASPDALRFVTQVSEIEHCLAQGVLAAVLHFEGAEAVLPDLSNLEGYYQRGLRSLGLVWSRPNAFACGVPFAFPASPDTGPGLTPAGQELVRECNRLGILIDLAHVNEQGFWDVAKSSSAPLVVTHTAAHAICPFTRNLTDPQIDAVGASGGVIGVIFEPMAVREDGKPVPETPLSQIVRHVDYIANRIGVEHVAFGSDFDGADVPAELGDASGLPKLLAALAESGWGQAEIEKVAIPNWLSLLKRTW